MLPRPRTIALALAACMASSLLVPATAPSTQQGDEEALEKGRQFTQWFFEGADEQLWELFSDQMKAAMQNDIASLENFRQQIEQQIGEEVEVLDETITEAQGYTVYLRSARFSNFEGTINVQFAFDAEGRIGGFYVRPAGQMKGSEKP